MNRAIAAVALTGIFVLSSPTCVFAQGGGGKGGPMAPAMAPAMAPSLLVAKCTVKAVNTTAMTFKCGSISYQASTSTTFQLGNAGSSFAGLAVGMAVTVSYQYSGATYLAVSVTSP
jgi:hypothetical protein